MAEIRPPRFAFLPLLTPLTLKYGCAASSRVRVCAGRRSGGSPVPRCRRSIQVLSACWPRSARRVPKTIFPASKKPGSSPPAITPDRSALRASLTCPIPLAVAQIPCGHAHGRRSPSRPAFCTTSSKTPPCPIAELRKIFGEEVAACVDGVTKLNKIDFFSAEDRQAENYRKMLLAMVNDIRVIIVKLADRLHNMRTLGASRPSAASASRARRWISTRPSRTVSAWAKCAANWKISPSLTWIRRRLRKSREPSKGQRADNEEYLEKMRPTVEAELAPRGHSGARRGVASSAPSPSTRN